MTGMDNRHYRRRQRLIQGSPINSLGLCNKRMLFYLASVGWGSLSIGYNFSLTLPGGSFLGTETLYNVALIDLIFYISDIGGMCGALIAGSLCDRDGRRSAILVGAAINLIATGVLTASVNLAMLLLLRVLVGVGLGIMLVAIPIWITEIAPPKGRAILNSIHPILILLGNALPLWIEYASSMKGGDHSKWRMLTGIGCAWPFTCLLFCSFLPESPRWLLSKGRTDQAWRVLGSVRSTPTEVGQSAPRLEFEQLVRQMDVERSLRSSGDRLDGQSSGAKPLFLACALNFLVLSSGIFVVKTYNFGYYSALGYYSRHEYVLHESVWNSAVFGMSILAIFVVNRMPRRLFIATGFFGCHASLIAQTYIAAVYDQPYIGNIQGYATAGIVSTYAFGLFYAACLFGSRFFYVAEILPNRWRARGMSFAVVMLYMTDILWIVADSYAIPSLTWKFFIIFIILTFLGIGIALRLCPDTRDLPLEEIGRLSGNHAQSNNRWNIPQYGNVDQPAWSEPGPMHMFQQPGPYEVAAGSERPELYGMRDPAEAFGHSRYEMSGRPVPAQLGGQEVYEFPSVNSRHGSHRQQF